MAEKRIKNGDIWYVILNESYENCLKGGHFVIVVSNYKTCNNSNLLNVVPVSSKNKRQLPCHVKLDANGCFDLPSFAIVEQTTICHRDNFQFFLGNVTPIDMIHVTNAIAEQFNFSSSNNADEDVLNKIESMIKRLNSIEKSLTNNFDDYEIIKEYKLMLDDIEIFCTKHNVQLDLDRYKFKKFLKI